MRRATVGLASIDTQTEIVYLYVCPDGRGWLVLCFDSRVDAPDVSLATLGPILTATESAAWGEVAE